MLLDAVKFHVDIISEAQKFGEPFTLAACTSELEALSKSGNDVSTAKIALQLAGGLAVEKIDGPADKAILNYAKRHDCAVATNDKNLIKALLSKGIRTIRLRQKRYLE